MIEVKQSKIRQRKATVVQIPADTNVVGSDTNVNETNVNINIEEAGQLDQAQHSQGSESSDRAGKSSSSSEDIDKDHDIEKESEEDNNCPKRPSQPISIPTFAPLKFPWSSAVSPIAPSTSPSSLFALSPRSASPPLDSIFSGSPSPRRMLTPRSPPNISAIDQEQLIRQPTEDLAKPSAIKLPHTTPPIMQSAQPTDDAIIKSVQIQLCDWVETFPDWFVISFLTFC